MDLADLIFLRKSCRKYSDEKISDEEFEEIKEFIENAEVLNDSIEFSYDILTRDNVKLQTRWSAPYYLALYSEKKDNYKENIGFVFQQVSLFMQSLGIGSCWVGMGSPKIRKDNFIILISFGKSDDITRDLNQFNRKNKESFSNIDDDRLLPAYYAPSAVNSQPWYFKQSGEGYDVYQIRHNIVKRKILGKWNPIDMGICLSHLYVSYQDSFEFKIKDNHEELKGYAYFGSVSF